MKPAFAILVALLFVVPAYGQSSNSPSQCADGTQPDANGQCGDGTAACPDGQVWYDGSCKDEATACEAEGGSWDAAKGECTFTCADGSQPNADGTCGEPCPDGQYHDGQQCVCSDGTATHSDGTCPPPACPDGSQPDSTGQCPQPACPGGTQPDGYGGCSGCSNADGTVCDPESECHQQGGKWNGEWCDYPHCPEDHYMTPDGGCEWKGEQCHRDGGHYDDSTGQCKFDDCPDGHCGDPCDADLQGFFEEWGGLFDRFEPRFKEIEADMKAGEERGHSEGWDRAQWDAYYYDIDKRFHALEQELMAAQDEIIQRWKGQAGDCAYRLDEFRFHPGEGPDGGDHRTDAERLRAECESRADALKDEYFHTDDEARREELEAEIRLVLRDCDAQARAIHDEHYDGDDFNDRFGTLVMKPTPDGRIAVTGKHLSFMGDPDRQLIEEFDCLGLRTLAEVRPQGDIGEVRPFEGEERATALGFWDRSDAIFMVVHDDRKCTVKVQHSAGIGSPIVTMPAALDCVKTERGLRCGGGDYEVVMLIEGTWEHLREHQVRIDGRATVFLVDQAVRDAAFGEGYIDALADNRIGAEATIAVQGEGVIAQAVTMGDMEMQVQGDRKKVTAFIESAGGIGKTVTMSFAADHFDDIPEIVIYEEQEDGSELLLEVREASSLEDILDPAGETDAPDAVEYWIVQDKNGMHVMLAFYHFSLKRVEVTQVENQSSSDGVAEAIPIPAWLVAAGLIAARRRR